MVETEKSKDNSIELGGIDATIKMVDEKYLSMMKSGQYQKILDKMACFPALTLRNALLVDMQNPEATEVKNMEAWNFVHRNIKENEKAMKIFVPVFEERYSTSETGRITREKSNVIIGYRFGYVFDISQTEGKELERFQVNKKNAAELYECFKSRILQEILPGFEIHEEVHKVPFAEISLERYVVTINKSLSPENKIKALVAETAAVLTKVEKPRNHREIEFEGIESAATAYIVTKRMGIPFKEVVDPSPLFRNDKEIENFKGNFYGIRSKVNRILTPYLEACRDYEKQKEMEKQAMLNRARNIEDPNIVINYPVKEKEYESMGASL